MITLRGGGGQHSSGVGGTAFIRGGGTHVCHLHKHVFEHNKILHIINILMTIL